VEREEVAPKAEMTDGSNEERFHFLTGWFLLDE
jgi:hypothetical protein